eukprot:TRINITY_DN2122_c0_g2_i3.p1 TRINITY_DN2122_c0_g2~~TRINITY_DN2122_c0_g2_i3.p1  ORF type:complete len:389 (-),score=101.14 TRINITY_DN2122_c0_g2_i3:203-1369(-)
MESKNHNLVRGFATRAIHTGGAVDPTTGAVIPPIHVSSTYEIFPGQTPKFIYGRFDNPTRTNLEKTLASLENAKHCIATSSGLAAVSIVYHMLKPGDHVISNDDLYGGTTNYLMDLGAESEGVATDFVDLRDLKALTAAIKGNTRLLWVETPTNPTLKVLDLEALATICKEKGILLVVDNTFLTPCLQNPLEFGADIVVHSCTKYIGGHSDIIMGCAMTNNEDLYKKMKKNASLLGCCPGPFDCYLASRGLKTLALRVAKAEENARKLAAVLSSHTKVQEVLYPGLASHPGHELMKKHARGFGCMITIKLKSAAEANAFYSSLSLFGHAVSLGGVESLVCIPVMVTHKAVPKELREKLGITDSMVRLSIGIEDVEDLKDDILQALETV